MLLGGISDNAYRPIGLALSVCTGHYTEWSQLRQSKCNTFTDFYFSWQTIELRNSINQSINQSKWNFPNWPTLSGRLGTMQFHTGSRCSVTSWCSHSCPKKCPNCSTEQVHKYNISTRSRPIYRYETTMGWLDADTSRKINMLRIDRELWKSCMAFYCKHT